MSEGAAPAPPPEPILLEHPAAPPPEPILLEHPAAPGPPMGALALTLPVAPPPGPPPRPRPWPVAQHLVPACPLPRGRPAGPRAPPPGLLRAGLVFPASARAPPPGSPSWGAVGARSPGPLPSSPSRSGAAARSLRPTCWGRRSAQAPAPRVPPPPRPGPRRPEPRAQGTRGQGRAARDQRLLPSAALRGGEADGTAAPAHLHPSTSWDLHTCARAPPGACTHTCSGAPPGARAPAPVHLLGPAHLHGSSPPPGLLCLSPPTPPTLEAQVLTPVGARASPQHPGQRS
ncbi:hypothetical protein VULLAG_LOCUS9893 [Vulpes lagopus]